MAPSYRKNPELGRGYRMEKAEPHREAGKEWEGREMGTSKSFSF
jgi:hypothetical protein